MKISEKTTVICRSCGWDGHVYLTTRNWLGKHPSVTGVPYPVCKKHKLRRIK